MPKTVDNTTMYIIGSICSKLLLNGYTFLGEKPTSTTRWIKVSGYGVILKKMIETYNEREGLVNAERFQALFFEINTWNTFNSNKQSFLASFGCCHLCFVAFDFFMRGWNHIWYIIFIVWYCWSCDIFDLKHIANRNMKYCTHKRLLIHTYMCKTFTLMNKCSSMIKTKEMLSISCTRLHGNNLHGCLQTINCIIPLPILTPKW